jgi:hypothetical protein
VGLSLPAGTLLTVETAWFPPLAVDLSGKSPPTAGGVVTGLAAGLAVRLLKPQVTVSLKGTKLAQWAPAGSPPVPNHWPATRVALLVVAGFVAYRLVRLVL